MKAAATLTALLAGLTLPLAGQQRPSTPQDTTHHQQKPGSRQSLDENELAAARPDNVPLDPSLRGFVALPGTEWILRLGGYAKTDMIFDNRPAGNPDLFVTSSIPAGDPAQGEGQSFNLHVKQTRINLELRRPSRLGSLRAFFEGDLYGPNGTVAPHFRHGYVQAGNLLVGQTFTTFMDVDALPDGVDFEGPGSGTFLFSPQIRYTWPHGAWSVAVAGEAPKPELSGLTAGMAAVARFPDLVVRPRYEAPWGHVQLSAVVRDLSYNDGVAGRSSTTGFGYQMAALVALTRKDNISLGAMGGRGLSRYVLDLGGLNMDAVADGAGGIDVIPSYGGYGSLQHRWTEWRAVLTAGWLTVEPPAAMPVTTTKRTQYYAATGIWSPRPTVDIGLSGMYGVNDRVDGTTGHAFRLQSALLLHLAR